MQWLSASMAEVLCSGPHRCTWGVYPGLLNCRQVSLLISPHKKKYSRIYTLLHCMTRQWELQIHLLQVVVLKSEVVMKVLSSWVKAGLSESSWVELRLIRTNMFRLFSRAVFRYVDLHVSSLSFRNMI